MTGWCVYFSVFVSSLHKSELLGSLGLARDTRKGFGKRMAEEWSSGEEGDEQERELKGARRRKVNGDQRRSAPCRVTGMSARRYSQLSTPAVSEMLSLISQLPVRNILNYYMNYNNK